MRLLLLISDSFSSAATEAGLSAREACNGLKIVGIVVCAVKPSQYECFERRPTHDEPAPYN